MSTEREQDLSAYEANNFLRLDSGETKVFRAGHDAATARAREERDRLRGLLAQCMASNIGDRLRGEIEVALGLKDHETPSL